MGKVRDLKLAVGKAVGGLRPGALSELTGVKEAVGRTGKKHDEAEGQCTTNNCIMGDEGTPAWTVPAFGRASLPCSSDCK